MKYVDNVKDYISVITNILENKRLRYFDRIYSIDRIKCITLSIHKFSICSLCIKVITF